MSANKKKNSTMSYYSIASTSLTLDKISCKKSKNYLKTIISPSLYYYWTEIMLQCRKINNWVFVSNAFHPCSWLYNTMPNKTHCYTKIGNKYSSCFYETIEILFILNFNFDSSYNSTFVHFGVKCENVKQACIYSLQNPCTNHFTFTNIFPNSFNTIVVNNLFIDCITLSSCENNEYSYALDILKQFCIAACIQKYKGSLVFKINSIFHSLTIDVLYLICSMYDKVYITKPLCTNPCEFSKYIVCKGFKKKQSEKMISTFQSLYFYVWNCSDNEYVERILSIPIPLYFLNKLEELNSIFGQPCLEHVYNILVNYHEIKSEKIKSDLFKCQEWCVKHNVIPYDQSVTKNYSFGNFGSFGTFNSSF